jgi:zinc transport system substrate-binding protein
MKKFLLIPILLCVLACAPVVSDEIIVAGTIYPATYLAENILGDKGSVTSVVPAGSEPHSYEPTPAQVIEVSKADLYFGIGLEFDHIEQEIISLNDMPIIILSNNIDLLEFEGDHHYEEEHEEEHGVYDPHFWVSPERMIQLVPVVLSSIQQLDPENKEYYATNAAQLIESLELLHNEYNLLESCERKDIIVNHAAFGYLAHDYNLEQHAVSGLSPEVEPTPQALATIIDEVEELGVTHIFFEELASPNVIETIARETGIGVLVLNPAGSILPGQDYDVIMRENLNNLKTALGC